MSAKSRSRKYLQLALRRGDYIISMDELESHVVVGTAQGRLFAMTRVSRYKRPYKVRELVRPQEPDPR